MDEKLIGKRVMIIGDHPYSGKCGTIDRIEVATAIAMIGAVVYFDDGLSGFVFDRENLKFI